MNTKIFSLFCFALLCALSYAAVDPLLYFANHTFEPGQNVTALELSGTQSIYVISADGIETYLFNYSIGSTINDSGKVATILATDVLTRAKYDEKASIALALADSINEAKKENEGECLRTTGLDAHNCTDKISCLAACYAAGQCAMYVPAEGFLPAIMDFNTQRLEYASLLSSYSDDLESAITDPSAIDGKSSTLKSLKSVAANLSQNPLFLTRDDSGCPPKGNKTCFEYCKKIDYSSSDINSAVSALSAMKTALASAQKQPARAQALLAAGNAQDDYVSTRGRYFEEMRLSMKKDLAALNTSINDVLRNMSDPSLYPAFIELSNLSSKIISEGDSGSYRKAFADNATYTSMRDSLATNVNADLALLKSTSSQIASLSDRVDKSQKLIGNSSAATYRARIGEVKSGLGSSTTADSLKAAQIELNAINASLTEEIAARATGEPVSPANGTSNQTPPPSQPGETGSKLPCAPALVAIVALAAAWRRI